MNIFLIFFFLDDSTSKLFPINEITFLKKLLIYYYYYLNVGNRIESYARVKYFGIFPVNLFSGLWCVRIMTYFEVFNIILTRQYNNNYYKLINRGILS